MEEYLKKVMEQIRCKKAHLYIEQELRDHMEDQIEDNVSGGMSREEAVKAAVKDMGDPVETGILLDRVHRPQIAWKMILMVGLISMAGVFIHAMIGHQTGINATVDAEISSSKSYLKLVCMGMLVMTALYWLDYTVIARFSRAIAACMIMTGLLSLTFGLRIHGAGGWFSVGGVIIPVRILMLLYVPVYGGVLYKYYATGYKGLLSSILWMVLPVFLVLRMPSMQTALLMQISMLVMLTIALLQDWFKVSKRIALTALWGVFGGLPVLGLMVGYLGNILEPYQQMRLQAFLTNSGEADYLTEVVRDAVFHSKFIGNNGITVLGRIGNANTDYLLTYLSSTYGLLAGIAVCGMIAALVFYIFRISRKQSSQLGMIMGTGCGMILIVSFTLNILVNTGMFPPTSTFLPFLSAEGGYIVVSYALTGIILSVYRFKNVYPRHICIDVFPKGRFKREGKEIV